MLIHLQVHHSFIRSFKKYLWCAYYALISLYIHESLLFIEKSVDEGGIRIAVRIVQKQQQQRRVVSLQIKAMALGSSTLDLLMVLSTSFLFLSLSSCFLIFNVSSPSLQFAFFLMLLPFLPSSHLLPFPMFFSSCPLPVSLPHLSLSFLSPFLHSACFN